MRVEQRLERLERQNKWMRRIGTVAVALVAAVFLMGQGKEKPRAGLGVGGDPREVRVTRSCFL